MNPELYHALKGEIQSLDNTAACMTLPEGTSPTTVRNWILHVAAVLGIPATVGKTPAGLLFWRSSEEDQQKAQEAAGRLQRSQHKGKAAPQRPARFTATKPVDHFGTVPTTPSTNQFMPSNISSTGFSPAAIRSLPG